MVKPYGWNTGAIATEQVHSSILRTAEALKPGKSWSVALVVAFACNASLDSKYEADTSDNEQSPADKVGEHYENDVQDVAHNCYSFNLLQI